MSNHKENNMARYKVVGNWNQGRTASVSGEVFMIESADIIDTKNGTRYEDGAYRVLRNGKAVKQGKGGTVPFYGEMAWADAERLFSDVVLAARYAV